MSKIVDWFRKHGLFLAAIIFICFLGFATTKENNKGNPVLKEYKDGIQNHLAWDIKGQCFFVRPNDDVTVYLIRVQDCDKK
jgi:hypothetical protein